MSLNNDLRLAAVNRHRVRTWGDRSLKLYTRTPDDGETVICELPTDWRGFRVVSVVSGIRSYDSGEWMFEISSLIDTLPDEDTMNSLSAFSVDPQRFVIRKLEAPIGESPFWKLRGEIEGTVS